LYNTIALSQRALESNHADINWNYNQTNLPNFTNKQNGKFGTVLEHFGHFHYWKVFFEVENLPNFFVWFKKLPKI
jgi:hypothetical protein